MKEMFKGMVNSPQTKIDQAINAAETDIKVKDGSVFPKGPNLAVIGTDKSAETILYSSVNNNILVGCTRGYQGAAKNWESNSPIARNFTEADLNAVQENIRTLDGTKVDEIDGKGLSTNDFTDAAKKKVDAIPADPKYTDTIQDLTPYAKKADIVTSVNGKKGDTMVDFFIGDDTRDLNYAPKDYLEHGVRFKANTNSQFEFKRCTAVGVSRLIAQTYCILNTQIPWANASGGLPMQVAYGKGVIATRGAIDEKTWGEWQKVTTTNDLSGFAKRADIKTRLADMTEDTSHRTVTDAEKKAWNNKVDKIRGKQLSTNDFSDLFKSQLQNLSVFASNIDTDGIYKTVDYNDKNGALVFKTQLIGTGPRYGQIKLSAYQNNILVNTQIWNLTYDDNDFLYKKEMQQ